MTAVILSRLLVIGGVNDLSAERELNFQEDK